MRRKRGARSWPRWSADSSELTVRVADGIITLTGMVPGSTFADVLKRMACAVPGVVDVSARHDVGLPRADPLPRPIEPPSPEGDIMSERQQLAERIPTRCGRTITVSRFTPDDLPPNMARVVLDTVCEPYDHGEVWASLTPEEARRIAGLLLFQAAAVEPRSPGRPGCAEVVPISGDAYEVTVRDHVLTVDQPVSDGGKDTAPTPVELFVASVATCVAHYAGRFLDRHGISRDGLRVESAFHMASDRPPRVASVQLEVHAPALPTERQQALHAVVSHCTVKNTLDSPPEIAISLCTEGCHA
jgi:uncharacterized OsmC-like protein